MTGQFTQIQNRYIRDPRLSAVDRNILLVLQSHMDEFGVCSLRIKTIAKESFVSDRTVQRSIKRLIDYNILCKKGTVISDKRTGKESQGANLYYIDNNPDFTGYTAEKCNSIPQKHTDSKYCGGGATSDTTPVTRQTPPINMKYIKNINIYKSAREKLRAEKGANGSYNQQERTNNSIDPSASSIRISAFWEEEELEVWREIKREMAQQKGFGIWLDKVEIIKTGEMRFIVQPSCPMYNGIKSENLLKIAERLAPQMKIEVNENKAYYLKGQVKKGSELL